MNEKSAKKESTRMKVMLKIQVQSISIDLSTAADAQNDPTTVGKVPTGTLSLTGNNTSNSVKY